MNILNLLVDLVVRAGNSNSEQNRIANNNLLQQKLYEIENNRWLSDMQKEYYKQKALNEYNRQNQFINTNNKLLDLSKLFNEIDKVAQQNQNKGN